MSVRFVNCWPKLQSWKCAQAAKVSKQWGEGESGQKNCLLFCQTTQGGPSISADDRALWEKLFTDVRNFDDYRAFNAATGSKGPDFRQKESGSGLW